MVLTPIRKSPILRGLGSILKRIGAVDPAIVTESVIQTEIVRESEIEKTGIKQGWGFRPKDISNDGIRRMRSQAHSAWINHPLAKKGMRMKRAFVCQEGFRVESVCKDPEKRKRVQEFLDKHWEINWQGKVDTRVESLGVYGDLAFWRPPVNTVTGHARIGALQRDDIEEVLPDRLNAERAGMIRMNQPITLMIDGEPKNQDIFNVFHFDWLSEEWKGEVLYLGVNRLDTMMRGISDLAPVLDWLEIFDQLTYTESERVKMLRSLLFHLKMKGKDGEHPSDKVLDAKRRDLAKKPPPPGSWYVSNDSEDIAILSGGENAAPTQEWVKFIWGIASGCIDLPEHWYYSSGDVNRASAKEMTSPIYAGIRDRKREFADFLLAEHCIALQAASKIPTSGVAGFTAEELEIEVRSRDPERDSLEVIGQHLLAFGQGLLLATSEGWITNDQAGQQFRQASTGIGLEGLDAPDEDPEALQNQAKAQMEVRRPQLEALSNVYPLAINEDPNWAIRSSAVR